MRELNASVKKIGVSALIWIKRSAAPPLQPV